MGVKNEQEAREQNARLEPFYTYFGWRGSEENTHCRACVAFRVII
jgi:hypothetical protein